jgi:hypothetical protein
MALGSTSVAAITREQWRSKIQTTMFGRKAGYDQLGYEVGEQDTRLPVDNIGTTAQSSLSPNGASVLSCTAASSAIQTMLDAVAGIYKQITQISSSTLGIAVQMGPNAQIITTAGTSFNQVTFAGVGHTVNLFCVSSSTANGPIWLNASPASPGLSYSTY